MNRETKKRKKQLMKQRMILMILASFLLGVLCGKLAFAKKDLTEETTTFEKESTAALSVTQEELKEEGHPEKAGKTQEVPWNLMLVNGTHFVEDGYEPKLAEVENNYMVDARIVKDLQAMLRDGRRAGMNFWICSAYRSMEKQIQLYDNKVKRLQGEGMSFTQAQLQAGKEVAYPGTSEHHLGLAVDIVAKDYQLLDEKQADTKEAKWLKENCWRYGFILRYPLDKTEETGIVFEPWHYRYVGIEAAKEIMEQGICLEEYLETLYGDM